MKITVLGSSGSVGQPGNPASGYLIRTEGNPAILMDLGPGVFAKLQQVHAPSDAHIIFSHLHADHCLDFPSLMVWRRFHPHASAQRKHICLGPEDSPTHLGRLSSDSVDDVDDMSDTFEFSPWQLGKPELIDDFSLTPFRAIHPIDSYCIRLQHRSSGKIIAYSGDTAYTEQLIECAKEADVFFCEATWGATGEGKAPNMHLSGKEAGEIARLAGAKRLVLVHIPPWCDPQESLDAARKEFDGPVELGISGYELEL
ncbi:MBL fold metallo-hydrolase [Corynebacterium sp. sy017]|uniref:MBL fold metallo-hydrolase n=1 Tax=unclassified Corynebacterium TaxID=2624378 RepID=UPI001184FCF4|nr:MULTISPECIES: MBL fold metallo-hydrolase [unclassified Corynebacterium]MBP3088167.1 MBL fold metallo-hydrolase [Corynebacterium sp. sy017]QDZ43604.1 MBL fold metallo-hydrolase [Corynebacterium sp. sy039]TSD92779.1 MBL fold metallo-hydrolase [Corynebacterium sp. SY003]